MTPDNDIERVVSQWLTEGPTQMPSRFLQDTLDRIDDAPQPRLAGIRTRLTAMYPSLRLAATVAVLLAVVGVGSFYLRPNGGVGVTPSAAPGATATAEASPTTFALGSIAFTRDGALHVAAPDGSQPIRVADGQPGSNEISKFAFSPDRRYLAYAQVSDPLTGAETLNLAYANGFHGPIYSGGANPNGPSSESGLTFGWAPDSGRLAVYPSDATGEIAIVGIDGNRIGGLTLPSGSSVSTSAQYWWYFAALAWSPDSRWLAVAVKAGGELSPCVAQNEAETCYILLATDGSGAQGSSDESSDYLAWAPDSRLAIGHWASSMEIRPLDGSAPTVIKLPAGAHLQDGHVQAWSLDGTRLVVATTVSGFAEGSPLQMVEGDGTVHPVPIDGTMGDSAANRDSGANVDGVDWSVDGQRLLFVGAPAGPATPAATESATPAATEASPAMAIWSVDVGGGAPTLLVDSTGHNFDVADGRP